MESIGSKRSIDQPALFLPLFFVAAPARVFRSSARRFARSFFFTCALRRFIFKE